MSPAWSFQWVDARDAANNYFLMHRKASITRITPPKVSGEQRFPVSEEVS